MSDDRPPAPEPAPETGAWDRFLAAFPFYYLLIAALVAALCAWLLPWIRGVVR